MPTSTAPASARRARKELSERYFQALNGRVLNWSIVAFPNEGWARSVFGEPDVERLWDGRGDGDAARRAGSRGGLA